MTVAMETGAVSLGNDKAVILKAITATECADELLSWSIGSRDSIRALICQ